MKIKKLLGRERSKRRWIVVISIIVMILMPYMVAVLNDQGLFSGWEVYFVFSYAGVVDILLLVNILRVISEDQFDMFISEDKIKIKSGMLKSTFSIPMDRIVYIDVGEKGKSEFEVIIVVDKGKRNKNLSEFNYSIAKYSPYYKKLYNKLKNEYPDKKLYCYIIKKAGARKYYYLYSIYKKAYNAYFSDLSIQYIKRFMEEYDLA